MTSVEYWEIASYIVTVIGLPLAIAVFLFEQRKERENEDEEAYQLLSDAYTDFLKLVLDNPDLQLRTRARDCVGCIRNTEVAHRLQDFGVSMVCAKRTRPAGVVRLVKCGRACDSAARLDTSPRLTARSAWCSGTRRAPHCGVRRVLSALARGTGTELGLRDAEGLLE